MHLILWDRFLLVHVSFISVLKFQSLARDHLSHPVMSVFLLCSFCSHTLHQKFCLYLVPQFSSCFVHWSNFLLLFWNILFCSFSWMIHLTIWRLICHKNQPTNQPNQQYEQNRILFQYLLSLSSLVKVFLTYLFPVVLSSLLLLIFLTCFISLCSYTFSFA